MHIKKQKKISALKQALIMGTETRAALPSNSGSGKLLRWHNTTIRFWHCRGTVAGKNHAFSSTAAHHAMHAKQLIL